MRSIQQHVIEHIHPVHKTKVGMSQHVVERVVATYSFRLNAPSQTE